jgi:hypothetical protein
MKSPCLGVVSLAICLAGCAVVPSMHGVTVQGVNCDLRSPPPYSLATKLHGTVLSTYPPKLEPFYSGCQSVWGTVNDVVLWQSMTQYVRGAPRVFVSRKLDQGATRETQCLYEGDRLVAKRDFNGGAEQQCPPVVTLIDTE